jgi:MtN3 and saliva related transmembrane protein
MSALITNAIGTVAAVCSITSFLPQVFKIAREKDASSVSLRMYVVTVIGFCLWSAYGVLLGSWPVAVSNILALGCAAAVLVMKLRFGDKIKT